MPQDSDQNSTTPGAQSQIAWQRWEQKYNQARASSSGRVNALQRAIVSVLIDLNRFGILLRSWAGWHRFTNLLRSQRKEMNRAVDLFVHLFGAAHKNDPMEQGPADDVGGYNVALLFSYENSAVLSSALPACLELRPPADAPPGMHPLVIGLGIQQNVRPMWRKPPGMTYLELVVWIPDVQLKAQYGEPRGPFLWLTRLHLDQLVPTMIGWLYGYPKHWSRVETPNPFFKVSTLFRGRGLLVADLQVGPKLGFATQLPHLQVWLDRLEDQPILSRRGPWGKFLCTHFHWEWTLDHVRAARVDVNVLGSAIPGLAPGQRTYRGAADSSAFDHRLAFVMSVPWRLTFPFDRKDYRPLPARAPLPAYGAGS